VGQILEGAPRRIRDGGRRYRFNVFLIGKVIEDRKNVIIFLPKNICCAVGEDYCYSELTLSQISLLDRRTSCFST
jgi:hypothetical protein